MVHTTYICLKNDASQEEIENPRSVLVTHIEHLMSHKFSVSQHFFISVENRVHNSILDSRVEMEKKKRIMNYIKYTF